MKKLLFFTIVLSGIIYLYSTTVNSSCSSILSLANVEALASTTPGEEAPPQSGEWDPIAGDEEFVEKINVGGHCYNVYKVNELFGCKAGGSASAVCGSIRKGKQQVPCSC